MDGARSSAAHAGRTFSPVVNHPCGVAELPMADMPRKVPFRMSWRKGLHTCFFLRVGLKENQKAIHQFWGARGGHCNLMMTTRGH